MSSKQTFILRHNPDMRATVRESLRVYLDSLPSEKEWRVEVSKETVKRTPKQLSSLFGVAYKSIMEQTGLEGARQKEQLHRNMCGEFFGWRSDPVLGQMPARTTTTNEAGEREEISIDTAMHMYAFIQRFMLEFDVTVPEPDPMYQQRQRFSR